jgi:hypothetical protein
MKRRMSVKGTAGTTPAPGKVNHMRRESSTFSPPNTRPASRLSDASKDVPPKVGKTSEHSSATARVTTLGKSVRINATTITPPGTASTNKVPTPTTVKPARTVEGSMGPPPTRQRASFSTTTSPTGLTQTHTRVTSTSSTLGRPGVKSPTMTNRRPSSMSGTELLRQAKLATTASSDVERSTSQQSSSGSASEEKENRLSRAPPPRATASLSASTKRRSMIAVPTS